LLYARTPSGQEIPETKKTKKSLSAVKKIHLGDVVHAFIPSTGDAEVRAWPGQGQHRLHGETLSQKQNRKRKKKNFKF
jgi:hypothetical protein